MGLVTVATDSRPGYDPADVAFAADLGQRMAAMVAAERLAARQQQLQVLTAALAAAGSAAEAATALTTSLREALDASVVAICTARPGRSPAHDRRARPFAGMDHPVQHHLAVRVAAAGRRRTQRPPGVAARPCGAARALSGRRAVHPARDPGHRVAAAARRAPARRGAERRVHPSTAVHGRRADVPADGCRSGRRGAGARRTGRRAPGDGRHPPAQPAALGAPPAGPARRHRPLPSRGRRHVGGG